MKGLVPASIYALLVVLVEVALFYIAEFNDLVSDYTMLITLFVFVGAAWVLKLKILDVIFALVLVTLYGVLSFYSDFPIYYLGYPASIMEFMSVLGVKTAFYVFPLLAYLAIGKKRKAV